MIPGRGIGCPRRWMRSPAPRSHEVHGPPADDPQRTDGRHFVTAILLISIVRNPPSTAAARNVTYLSTTWRRPVSRRGPSRPRRGLDRGQRATERADHGAGLRADPVRVGSELGLDREAVLDRVGAVRADRPAPRLVEQHVLDVLRHQSVDERRALLPLRQPPPSLGDAVLDHRHGVRVDETLRREVCSTRARAFSSGSTDVMASILAL